MEYKEILITPENATDIELLEAPSKRDFGSEGFNANIEYGNIRIRIGQRPIVFSLLDFYEKTKKEIPDEYEMFMSYDVWVIAHSISVVDNDMLKRVSEIGYQVVFPNEPRVTIIDMLPQTKFIKHLEANLSIEADLGLNGHAQTTIDKLPLLNHIVNLQFGGQLNLSSKVDIAGRLSFSVITPEIITVGIGDFQSEWIFKRHDKPLIGDQIMVQVLLVPFDTDELTFKTRVHSTISLYNLIPSKWKSDWIELSCKVSKI